MPAPTVTQVHQYVGTSAYTEAQVTEALAAEKAAQAKRCRVPADEAVWPADLVEALKRRVAAALALRAVPLGVAVSITDTAVATDRVGGLDTMVRRLEAPYVRLPLG